ncbi:MAG: response regulator, partial [Anaerolineae bacterium]|nr:response regulator [Anaerolineae bacterium]
IEPAIEPILVPPPDNRLELLRLEAARLSQTERYANIVEIIQGVLGLLQEKFRLSGLTTELQLPETENVWVDKRLLRQLLLAILGYLADIPAAVAVLRITGEIQKNTLELVCQIDPASAVQPLAASQERLNALDELSGMTNVAVQPLNSAAIYGFQISIPMPPQHTVLVIDDNEDILTLFQRYLSLHHYHVATAGNAQDAILLAQQLQPFAITLDLMMPDQDGWDLLQTFLNHPGINATPIVVCSVLRQKELALSLGATAFLEKPVSEEALLTVLTALHT